MSDSLIEKKKEIHAFWERAALAETDEDGLLPTARDPFLQAAVEDAMGRYLRPGASLLDVGCGDGTSTVKFSATAGFTLGIDYSEGLVRRAAHAHRDVPDLTFSCADATDLADVRHRYGPFGTATSIRCLINLPSWDMQASAIREIALCIEPGGLLLISEGWEDGWERLNLARTRVGLASIAVVEYNLLIRRSMFEAEVGKYFDILNYHSLGLYLFMSRVAQPFLMAPDPPVHTHELNGVGSELQSRLGIENRFSDMDYAGVYVLRRK